MVKRKRRDEVKWIEDHLAAASLAYKRENVSDMTEKVKLSQAWEFYKTFEGPHGTQCKVWVSPTNGNVLVAFRGTSSLKELKLDVNIGSDPFLNKDGEKVGYVYRGFNTAWKDFKEKLELELRVMQSNSFLPPGGNLQFTGHSLGGAIAEIASTYFSDVYPTLKVTETSIAAPSSGDVHFGDYSRTRPNLDRIRIVSKGDPISNTKLPGMDFVERENVIELEKTKRSKNVVMDVLKGIGRVMFPIGTFMAEQVDESYQNHMLETYATSLIKDFQDVSQLTLGANIPKPLPANQTTVPVEDGSCRCECHVYDLALQQGKVPPTSLATIPDVVTPENTSKVNNLTTSDPMVVKEVTDLHETKGTSAPAQDVMDIEEDERELVEKEPSELEQMIQEILETSNQKDQEKLDKLQEKANTLQEQYAYITNKADEEHLDPVRLDRERFEKAQQDINYFESRVQMEIEHPQYVPNDRDGTDTSRKRAIQLKNRLNKVYGMVQSVKSKQYTTTLDPAYKPPDEQTTQKDLAKDQTLQAQETLKDKQLDPDQQPGNLIFDIDLLGDLDTTENDPKALEQIGKWLSYSGMTPRDLYDNLNAIMVNKYKNDRLAELRNDEQTLRQKSADDIRVKIDELKKEAGSTENTLALQKQRKAFVTKIASNPEIMQLVQAKKVDIQKISDNFKSDMDSSKLMTELLGYDSATWERSMEQDYLRQLDDVARATPDPKAYGEAMYDLQAKFEKNKRYPWVTAQAFQKLPQNVSQEELDKAALKLRSPVPSQWAPSPLQNVTVDNKLLERQVEALPDATGEIKDLKYRDFYQEERNKLEEKYNNPEALKELFQSWNPGQGGSEDMLGNAITAIMGLGLTTDSLNAWKTIANGGVPESGWFDKSGKFLGSSASPDFMEYARAHPEMGFKYKGPESTAVSKFFDVAKEVGGEYIGMRYGINPFEIEKKVTGMLGPGTNYDKNTGVIRNPYEEEPQDESGGEMLGGMNPMMMMLLMNQGKEAPHGETPPKPSLGYNRKPPVKTRPGLGLRSKTSKISI